MTLYHRHYGGSGGIPNILLHGLLGSSDNWHTLAQHFGSQRTTYSLDLPGPMKAFFPVLEQAGLEGKLGAAFGSHIHDVGYTHDDYAPAIILKNLEDIAKMEPFELGPFNLQEEVADSSEGMKACHDFGKAFGEELER